LEVVCAAYEPLTLSTLSAIFNWSVYKQHEMAAQFNALLYVAEDGYLRPFHSSVLDWVQDIKTAGGFYADATNGHECLARWAVQEYDRVMAEAPNDFVNLKYANDTGARVPRTLMLSCRFDLEQLSETKNTTDAKNNRMHVYIVRHVCNHLMVRRGVL
jgi:hypothetical protein